MPANYQYPSYFGQSSHIHRLDPRSKILFTLIYILSVAVIAEPLKLMLLAGALIVLVQASHVSFGYLWQGMKPFFIIIVFTVVIQALLTGGSPVFTWRFINISAEGLRLASLTLWRLLLIILSSQILLLTTSPMDLTDGLDKILFPLNKLGIATGELLMIMTIAIQFIPLFLQEALDIREAQTARGADFNSGSPWKRLRLQLAILVPLVTIVLQRAEELIQFMESRGYSPGQKRTRLHEMKMMVGDYVVVCLSLVAGFLVFIRW